jgi:hypothetical protein
MADIEAIRKRAEAATPGPWGWFGNTDVKSVFLATKQWGCQTVMDFARWGMNFAQPEFVNNRSWVEVATEHGYRRLDFNMGRPVKAKEIPVYEVAPHARSRTDERVYRADLVGLRNPDAEFIAHSRQDIADLLAEVDRLRAQLAERASNQTISEALCADDIHEADGSCCDKAAA